MLVKELFVQEICNGGCTPGRGFPCPYPNCPKGIPMPEFRVRVPSTGPGREPYEPHLEVVYRREWETFEFETLAIKHLVWGKVV